MLCSVCLLASPHPAACRTVGNIPFAMLTLRWALFKVKVRLQQKLKASWGMGGHSVLFCETMVYFAVGSAIFGWHACAPVVDMLPHCAISCDPPRGNVNMRLACKMACSCVVEVRRC